MSHGELCCECKQYTEKARGTRRESIYCAEGSCGMGPFCDECNDKHCVAHNQSPYVEE